MSRVGKSATKTGAETRESDLISICSCVCKIRAPCRKPRFHHCSGDELSLNKDLKRTMPQSTQEGSPAARPENHCYLIPAFIVPQLGPWMPSLLGEGCWFVGTQQLLHLEATQTQLANNRLPASFFAFQFTRCNNLQVWNGNWCIFLICWGTNATLLFCG